LHNWENISADSFDWAFGQRAHDLYLQRPSLTVPAILLRPEKQFTFPGYEITALSLHALVSTIKQSENISDPIEIVIAVSPALTAHEKVYLYAAGILAGVKVTQFVDFISAPAQLYGLEWVARFRNRTHTAAFVDVGAYGVRVSIWEFEDRGNDTRATQLAGQFVDGIGSASLDSKLADFLVNKYGLKIGDARTRVGFLQDCQEVKEALGSFPAVEIEFSGYDDEDDKNITVYAEDLLGVAGDLNRTILAAIAQALNQSGRTKIDVVEMLGGGSRSPFVQSLVRSAFNVSVLNWSLNTDHAIAFGAAYAAARNSREFTVRGVELEPLVSFPAWLRTGGRQYQIYAVGSHGDSATAVGLRVRPNQEFLIATDSDQRLFMRFILENVSRETEIDLLFTQNDYLMPIPYNASMAGGMGLEVLPQPLDWEVSPDELRESMDKIASFLTLQQAQRVREKAASDFEGLLIRLQQFCRVSSTLESDAKEAILTVVSSQIEWFEGNGTNAQITEYLERAEEVHNLTDEMVDRAREEEARPIALSKIVKTISAADAEIEKASEAAVSMKEPSQSLETIKQWVEENGSVATSAEITQKRAEVKRVIGWVKERVRRIQALAGGMVEVTPPEEEAL
jgi:molecular chaperone DnaK (HSP70)